MNFAIDKLFLGLILLASSPCLAIEVLYTTNDVNTLVVRQDVQHPWQVGEFLCLDSRGQQEIRCGKVISATKAEATVFLTLRGEGFRVIEPPRSQ